MAEMVLSKLDALAVLLMTFSAISTESAALPAQNAPKPSQPAIVVSITLDNDRIPIGQSPWAILAVKNLADHDVVLRGPMIRLHVEDKKGERPMTRVQRNITHKLLPGEAPLPGVGGIWSIAPGETSSHKYELSYFYDLSESGEYKAYMDVVDPSSRKSLRTDTVQFEMQSPTQ